MIIPNTVTAISARAFQDCSALVSLTNPNSVTEIANVVFQDCTSLTSIVLPDELTTIGVYAFKNCSKLQSISFPKSLTKISPRVFDGCTGLSSVTCEATTQPTMSTSFDDAVNQNSPLSVPQGCKAAYQSADNWSAFLNIIEMEGSGIDDVAADESVNCTYYDLRGIKVADTKGGEKPSGLSTWFAKVQK